MNLLKTSKRAGYMVDNTIEQYKTSNWKAYYTPKATSSGCNITKDISIPNDMRGIEVFLPVVDIMPIGKVFVVSINNADGGNVTIHAHQKVKGVTSYVSTFSIYYYGLYAQPFIWLGKYCGWMPLTSGSFPIRDEAYPHSSFVEGNGSGENGIGLSLLN